ncbi:hypothetical protein JCM11491_006801 [Sporobolomyces phaffii]
MTMTLPTPPDILACIRSSCRAASLPLNTQAIDDFIRSVSEPDWARLSGNHGVRLPLKFDSPRQELNLLVTIGLLNFLSGYRTALHRLTGRGAYSTVLSLVLSAYLSADPGADSNSILSARGMAASTVGSIASLAQITTHREAAHPTLGPAVQVGTKDPDAFEVLELVVGVLHETGETLEALEVESLGAWFEAELCRTRGDVGEMIHSMATTFPAFKDVDTLDDGAEVFLFKKALWTLNAVHARFSVPAGSESDDAAAFPVPNRVDEWPVFADNVLPSMLVHYNILETPPVSPSPVPRPTVLRASAVYACQRIVERAHELADTAGEDLAWLKGWNEVGLDGYLWSLAKEGGRREAVERVVEEKGTVFY